MFEYLAKRPPLRHRHIASDDIINGTGGLPARRDFDDAIGFVVRSSFHDGNILEYLGKRPQQSTVKLRLVSRRLILGKQVIISAIRLLRFPVLSVTFIRRISSTEMSAQYVPNLERKKHSQEIPLTFRRIF